MIYTSVESPLWYLQWLEKEGDLDSPLKDQVLTLKEELRFMRTYLVYLNMAKGIPSGSSSVINSVEAAIINSTKDLSSACLQFTGAAGAVVCSMLEKVKECKQEIRKDYAILWDQPWKTNTVPPCLAVKEFVESILDNIRDLLGSKSLVPLLKENIESLKENMNFIAKFVSIMEKRKIVHQNLGHFLAYVQVVVTRGACLSYFCWFDEANASRMDIHFSDLMQLSKRCASDCVDMCFEVLKTSRDEVEWFVDFLLGNSADCIEDHIGTIREHLMYLLKLSMALPGHCKEDLRQISADIRAVAKETRLLCISKAKDDHFHETSVLLSSLLQKMSLIREKISRIHLKSFEGSGVLDPVKDESVPLHEKKKEDQQVTSLNYSIHANKLTEDLVIKVNDALVSLLRKIDVIRADMIKLKAFRRISRVESDFKDGKWFFALPEDVAIGSSSLNSSFHVNEMTADRGTEVNISIFKLTDIIKAELFLLEIRVHEVSLKDQAEKLLEGLRFLRAFLMNPPRGNNKEREFMLTKCVAMAAEAASEVIFSLYENAMKENMGMELNLKILEVLRKTELLKVEIRKAYLQVPRSLHANLPDGLVFVSSLLAHIKELLNYKAHSIHFVKPQIEMLQAELLSLQYFLKGTARQHNEHEALKDLWTCIADVAYEAEYRIDSSVFGDDPEWYFMLWVPFAMEKIKLLNSRIKEIYDKNMYDIGVHYVNYRLDHQSSMDYNVAVGENVVGFDVSEYVVGLDDDAYFVTNQLTRGSGHLRIVAIVGLPGLGKTTLAKKVYYSRFVAYHFHVQAWCSASREYRKRELLIDILHGIGKDNDIMYSRSNDDDIAALLYKCLKGKRYLIVLDDLEHAEALDALRILLPDDNNGSRVLLTSQLRQVGLHANPCNGPLPLRLLSAEESWTLLQKKIFFRGSCPPLLLGLGKQISGKCKGIPLVLVLMAGLLARAEKTSHCWEQILKGFNSNVFIDLLEDVFELCYRHLPDHLKPCFLYFGAFPENKEISASKLFRLWIAEGFIQPNETNIMENVAEDYLADLIGRGLVSIARRSSNHGIKACHIHDWLWDFCRKKAKEENFFHLTHWSQRSKPFAFEQRRLCLCIDAEVNEFIMSRPSASCVRSLLCTVSDDTHLELTQQVSFFTRNFKLLRVLDLESVNIGNSFPTGLQLLELLRYLAVKGGLNSLPSSIINLLNLETLIVKGTGGPIALPNSFWAMKKLRHVHILPYFTFNFGEDELDYSNVALHILICLSTLKITQGESDSILRKLAALQKLKCILIPSSDSSRRCHLFPILDFLCQLESLTISRYGRRDYPCELSFPSHLKKLTLSGLGLPWNEISKIGKLPMLEILKLKERACKGEEWTLEGEEFLRLRYLKMESLYIVRWEAPSDSFPCLERLVIHRCRNLKEIPSSLAEIPTLQMIEMLSCSRSAVNSARQILKEQRDVGNDEMTVIVDSKNE